MSKPATRSMGKLLIRRSERPLWSLLVVTIATTISLTAVLVGGRDAQGDASPPPTRDRIGFHVAAEGGDVLLDVDGGSLTVVRDQLQVIDRDRRVVASAPLRYEVAQRIYRLGVDFGRVGSAARVVRLHVDPSSIAAAVGLTRRTAAQTTTTVVVTSTPSTPATSDADARADRLDKAFTRMGTELTLGMAIGTSVGTILGGVGGCLVGLAAGIVGCVPGLVAGATTGAIVGSVVIGGAAAIVSLVVFGMTMSAPVPQTKTPQGSATQTPVPVPVR
mgnify:CR=1 FL=1